MTTWYKLTKYGEIEPVELVKETAAFVTVKSATWDGKSRIDKLAKTAEWHACRPTKRECYEWLLGVRTAETDTLERQLSNHKAAIVALREAAKKDGVEL
jgi:hypothetical protein